MSAYLFQIELPAFTDEMAETLPTHREHVNTLFAEGLMLSYSVSAQRNMVWCVLNAEDEQQAMDMVAKFPMHRFFADISCHALLFHNTLPASLPGISLN